MNEVIQAAAEVQTFCEAQGWRFCFIGGLALQRWGQPRETVDVDLTLLTGWGGEESYIRTLLDRFESRIANAEQFALPSRVVLLRSSRGVGLDVALGALEFEELAVQRSSLFEYPLGVKLRTCSAEDLIVMKAFAGREQDWVDVSSIIIRQAEKLDWDYIWRQLKPLAGLKDDANTIQELERRRTQFE